MSVSFITHVQQRTWRGYDDPGLPVGMYISQGAVTGDATGGNATVIHQFRGEGVAASGRFYNVEQIEILHTDPTTRNVFMSAVNWDLIGPVGLVNREWGGQVRDDSNGVAVLHTDRQFPLPIFFGITSPIPSLAAQVALGIDNIDLTSFVSTIQGYIWEPRSVLSEGGLRRPSDSLWGNGRQ